MADLSGMIKDEQDHKEMVYIAISNLTPDAQEQIKAQFPEANKPNYKFLAIRAFVDALPDIFEPIVYDLDSEEAISPRAEAMKAANKPEYENG